MHKCKVVKMRFSWSDLNVAGDREQLGVLSHTFSASFWPSKQGQPDLLLLSHLLQLFWSDIKEFPSQLRNINSPACLWSLPTWKPGTPELWVISPGSFKCRGVNWITKLTDEHTRTQQTGAAASETICSCPQDQNPTWTPPPLAAEPFPT